MIKPGEIAIVGAAETTKLGAIPGMAQIMLHADAALNAMEDAGRPLPGIGPNERRGTIREVGNFVARKNVVFFKIYMAWLFH